MIKVLHIVLGLQVGGLERFVLDLINKYPPDIKPFIVCLEGKGELGLLNDNLEIYEIKKAVGFSLNTIQRLVSLARQLEIDIIHTHNPGPHFYGSLTGFLTRIPVVHTKHGRNYPTEKKKVWLNRMSSLLTHKIVAVSRDAAEVSISVEKIPKSKVFVILNGIDTNIFRPPDNKDVKIQKVVRIGIVARLSAEKDHQTLLKSCRLLAHNNTKFHLDIFGDGPLRGTLEKTVNELDIDAFISFYGTRHDIPEQLRQIDIFALSSTTEGISLTLLEAMATGLPVVATNVGGNPEVVIDGETGYIVPPRDPIAMAEKLLFLINDEKIRRQMGEKGRKRIINQFSINQSVKHYEKIYRSLIR